MPKAVATYKPPQQYFCGYGPFTHGPNGERCFDDGSGAFYASVGGGWVYSNWPSGFPNTAIALNISNEGNDTWTPITQISFDYDVIFDDGRRKLLLIRNYTVSPRPTSFALSDVGNGYTLYDPIVWDNWFTVKDDFSVITKYNTQQIQQILDSYVKQAYDTWKSSRTSFWKDALPGILAFAAIVVSAGALTQPASAVTATATDVGVTATASSIPTYIAAPVVESTIPQYIAATTLPAALPVEVALGTDASVIGLTGAVGAAETSSIYGSVENLISQGKDLVAQYKPVISDITKLKTAYDIASGKQPTKPTPVKSTQASGAVPRGSTGASGLIPIGIILGLLLLA